MSQADHTADPAPHEIIESIVELTEQRDQRSLEFSLFASLQEMLEPRDCWLLSLDTPESAVRVVAGDASLLPPEIVEAIKVTPHDFDMRFVQIGGKEYLLASTLSAESEHTRLLVIARGYWDENNLRLAQGMLRVYQNFVSILRDSEKDTLTGLLNRRKLEAKLNDLLAASLHGRRYKDIAHSDFLAVFDLDLFKRVNDNYGHLIGDETLLSFANILRRTLRDDDLIFRYGGEEFVILLQELSVEQAGNVLERVRRAVEKYAFPQVGQVTVSGGYTVLKPGATPPRVIEEADRALYYAKEHGRNQVHSFHALVNSGELDVQQEKGSIELF